MSDVEASDLSLSVSVGQDTEISSVAESNFDIFGSSTNEPEAPPSSLLNRPETLNPWCADAELCQPEHDSSRRGEPEQYASENDILPVILQANCDPGLVEGHIRNGNENAVSGQAACPEIYDRRPNEPGLSNISWEDHNIFGREMFGAGSEPGSPPPPYSRYQDNGPAPNLGSEGNASSATRSDGSVSAPVVVTRTLPPGYRSRILVFSAYPEPGARRLPLRGTIASRGDATILSRDIPVSDRERIIPSSRTVNPQPVTTAQNRWKTRVGLRMCICTTTLLMVILPAILAPIILNKNSSQSNKGGNNGIEDIVPGGKFYGSFLFEENWDPEMSDVGTSTFKTYSKSLQQVVDQFYAHSYLAHRFDHSTVTELSKSNSGTVQVSVVLKLRDSNRADPSHTELQATDLQQAFLSGLSSLIDSTYGISSELKALAMKIIASSVWVTSTPATTTTMTPAYTERHADGPCGEVRVLPNLKIVGGSEALQGEYPWMVMLTKNADGSFFCGGSILDRWNIITAAHCLQEESKDYWTDIVDTKTNNIHVIAGKHLRDTTMLYPYEQRIPAQAGYMHAMFSTAAATLAIQSDIAVIRLSRPLQFNSRVAPICLPLTSDSLPPVCVVAGWGAFDYENQNLPKALHTATLRTYNRTECQRQFQNLFSFKGHTIDYFLKQGVFCASNSTFGGQDTCQGDSGGPLFCLQRGTGGEQHYTQFGVVSWGVGCGNPGEPGFYTFLPDFVSWVETQALPKLDQYTSSEHMDSTCSTFEPMTDFRLYSCQTMLEQLKSDSQCSGMGEAVNCVVQAFGESNQTCTEEEVFSIIVSDSSVGLSSLQQQRCRQVYNTSQPHTNAICQDHSKVSDAVRVCTQNVACVSTLEVTLCVHTFVDPSWQQCSRQSLQDFIMANFNDTVRICKDYTLRTMADGRHFIYMDGDWHVLCGDHWGQHEVNAACAQQGFRFGNASYLHKTDENVYVSDFLYEYSGVQRSIKAAGWLQATCKGHESQLSECHLVHQTTCSSSYLAASLCYDTVYKFSLDTQEAGPGLHGYMILSRDAGRGTVCVHEKLSDNAAHLLCRGAGYVGGMTYPDTIPPSSATTAIWVTEMHCSAGAVDVNGCARGNWTLRQRRDYEACTPAKVFCFRHDVRLHNGLYNWTGIVQMYLPAANGHGVTLKTVCRQGFDDVTARLVCRQAWEGMECSARSLSFNPFYKPNTEYVSIHCYGQESSVDDCSVRMADLEVCTEPAVVMCSLCNSPGNGEPDLSVRLSNSTGQVEVSMGHQWGSVCTDHWTDNEAAAVCRQLGYRHGYRRFSEFQPNPRRSVPHVLHGVHCEDDADSLHQCSYQPVTSDVCQHSPPATVVCSNSPMPVYLIQSSDASLPNEGQVYVSFNGTTAPLGMYQYRVNVSAICQMLGYVDGEREAGSAYSEPTGNLFFTLPAFYCEEPACLQDAPLLVNCTREYSDSRCSMIYSVFVHCYHSGARVSNGAKGTLGIVQLYRSGTWWDVCHDDITQPAADVICRDIMRSTTASAIILRDVYRLGFYPTVRASVYCDVRDPGMTSSDCIELDLNSTCESFNSDPASVVCYDGQRPSDEVTSWKIESDHRLWALRYGVWGTVCFDDWSDSLAQSACRHVYSENSRGVTGLSVINIPKHYPTTPLWVWSVSCDFASDLSQCTYNLTSVDHGECRSNMDATAICTSLNSLYSDY